MHAYILYVFAYPHECSHLRACVCIYIAFGHVSTMNERIVNHLLSSICTLLIHKSDTLMYLYFEQNSAAVSNGNKASKMD